MNKIKLINLTVLLICTIGFNVYEQRKEILPGEYANLSKKASENRKKMRFRIVTKSEHYFGNELKNIESNIVEFIPPNKTHLVSEMKSFNRMKVFSTETIRIGDDNYKRENGGDWIKQIQEKVVSLPSNFTRTIANNAKAYLTENVQFNNQIANLYEITVKYTHQVQTSPANKEVRDIITYHKDKIWMSRDGLLLKSESEDESPEPVKFLSRRSSVYEYDSSIKIEAPVLKAENKN
jgi:hypothetical protein